MYWETLPSWVWVFYYLCLFLTLGTGIFNVIRKRMLGLSIIAIVLTITVPIISLLNRIGRAKGMNEFEHLVAQLQQGSIWSIYAIFGFLYMAIFLIKNMIHNRISKSQQF